VHIVGIGGAGMSAIATVLLAMGHTVSGSDAADSGRLRRLAQEGAQVRVGHDPAWLGGADLVVVSTAIPPTNVEAAEAVRRGLRVWRRAEALAAICAERRTIAIAGTHGKTSTSAMLAVILHAAGWRPSYIIGSEITGLGPGAAWQPDGEWLVVEADESDGTFLMLGAEAVLVTSVEPDHVEFYGSMGALDDAFHRFVAAAPGPRVLCADDAGAAALAAAGASPDTAVLTYGTAERATVRIEGVTLGRAGCAFSIVVGGHSQGPVQVGAPGLHNVRNAAGALTMAASLGVSWESAIPALVHYQGVARRAEHRGERDGVVWIDDYGHLPGEVAPMLAAVAAGGWRRVVAVFQPHRFSRTEALWRDFRDAFTAADVLLVTDIYPAGEPPRPGISGQLIVDAVHAAHPGADVRYVPTLDAAAAALGQILQPGDVCVTLGAGDLTTLPDRFLARPGADHA
jgi:UDP-N-acetylmuramate--alanine ligase